MNRRDALKTAGLLVGGMVVASTGVLAACRTEPRTKTTGVLSLEEQNLMEEIADTILPTTASSPGAQAAGVGPVINLILTDCYDAKDQQRLTNGLRQFRRMCDAVTGKRFAELSRAQRETFLQNVESEAKTVDAAAAVGTSPAQPHYYRLLRELAEGAYWSSEVGMTQALRYIRVPGHYTGCMPLEPGQPAWG